MFLVSPALASDFFTTVPPRKLFTVSDIYFDHLGREIYILDWEEKPTNITQSAYPWEDSSVHWQVPESKVKDLVTAHKIWEREREIL